LNTQNTIKQLKHHTSSTRPIRSHRPGQKERDAQHAIVSIGHTRLLANRDHATPTEWKWTWHIAAAFSPLRNTDGKDDSVSGVLLSTMYDLVTWWSNSPGVYIVDEMLSNFRLWAINRAAALSRLHLAAVAGGCRTLQPERYCNSRADRRSEHWLTQWRGWTLMFLWLSVAASSSRSSDSLQARLLMWSANVSSLWIGGTWGKMTKGARWRSAASLCPWSNTTHSHGHQWSSLPAASLGRM